MSNRIHQPLIFSIDNRLSEQHLTRLDLCSKNLKKIDNLPNDINFNIILFDYNEINKLEHLEHFPQLIQLSISHNHLVDIRLLNRLRSIEKLNLSHNLIDSIDSLKSLQNLVMLNISNNNISSIAILNSCHALQSLDASGNSIQQIEDLSQLTKLKYLNLHKNFIDTLNSVSRHWPKSLHTLVISDNEIQDLTEISYLSSFISLNTLYIIDNPCLSTVNERHGCHQSFDYRSYILNWCLSIHNLDGIFITRKESLKAEWLLSQGKGRSFIPGEHAKLVEYLIRVCGTDGSEKDDLNLSRIMLQQDIYTQQRQNENTNDYMMLTSDTMKDASEILPKNTQRNLQQSTLISESEFIKLNVQSSISSDEEPIPSTHEYQNQIPNPGYTRSASINIVHTHDPISENNSANRYNEYDERPVKPLDQNMLQTKLNQYPVDSPNDNSNSSRLRAYNANHYSPITTTTGPTTSSIFSGESNRTLAKQHNNRVKHERRHSTNTNALQLHSHPNENLKHHSTTTNNIKIKQQQPLTGTSKDNKNQHTDNELQSKSAPINTMLLTQSTTMNNTTDLDKLTTSVETMRTSILQAYLDLHERFTKTTELQTSALSTLWKKCESQNLTHQRETEKIIQENQLLNQRIRELENRLNTNLSNPIIQASNSTPKQNLNIYPPLRAHISKRDTKSFFLHWIPNPLNEHHNILGYRIYVDDILKGAIDPGRFEAIIDYIRDEGEYKIKIRTFNQDGESADSNIVVARFRRQHSTIPSSSESASSIHRTQSDHIVGNIHQRQSNENLFISPREQIQTPIIMIKRRTDVEQQDNFSMSPEKQVADAKSLFFNDYVVSRKPPVSPSTSPSKTDKRSPNNESHNNNDSSSIITKKHSPSRAGIMSRLTRSTLKLKQNNNHNLFNVPPIERSNSPTESMTVSKAQVNPTKRAILFQPDRISHDSDQQIPSADLQNSVDIHDLVTHSDIFLSHSLSPPISSELLSRKIDRISIHE
ncbi:unnamed protein product [Adineta steineri]|uniref:Centrosomal protein of 97 kDa n=1 Tax=Adineta steineri TaxID=433720 RepID=A0A818VAL9_9BILA|nr:unnamed protein product [Adineta steineri]CAF3712277.1 unnamed protein product [Adineta steineri]